MLKIIKKILEKFFREPSDPMKIVPSQVAELVFVHLSFNELLQCSLVNKNWYKLIAKSPKCMEKFRICICEPLRELVWNFSGSDAYSIVNGRSYKHISMLITRNFTEHHLMLLASFKWRSVTLCDHIFKSEIELVNFLGLIEPTVVELVLRTITISFPVRSQISGISFFFPNLKYLRMSNCCTFILSEVFNCVKQLEKLEIETSPPPVHDHQSKGLVKAIEAILVRNTKIKFLQLFICQNDFDDLFMDQRFFLRFRFQLEELRVKKFRKLFGDKNNDLQIIKFGEFLQSQSQLRSLHILEWLGNDILELVINTMDRLKILKIREIESYGVFGQSLANINFFNNESIESLDIYAKHSKGNELQKMLLKNVPNLKMLSIDTVTQTLFEILVEKAEKIEILHVDVFSAYIVPEKEVLKCLKEINIGRSFSRNFKDIMRDNDVYTNFEKVFLTAVMNFNEIMLKRSLQ